ncbi:DUF2339 domain-containing protein [Schaalia sp. 19OD2882]|uniref:DUF2339 domain-containing protein n=1 Tax=Schaalia sp. 19OD2882 TaxID=2794089 RepID=UPI001C1F1E16|nr:DUF2339 domain-containing protein [Schaalia sp. 19OD2882]QWW19321.1 DUF2339 domain-containing protein [Schaalia sp. 19OD2882]
MDEHEANPAVPAQGLDTSAGSQAAEVLRAIRVLDSKVDALSLRLDSIDQRLARGTAPSAPAFVAPAPAVPTARAAMAAPAAPAPAASAPAGAPALAGGPAHPAAPMVEAPRQAPAARMPLPSVGAGAPAPALHGSRPPSAYPQTAQPVGRPAAPRAAGPQGATGPQVVSGRPGVPTPTGKAGESKVGKYLLAGAAALLVFLSGATLIAMLWNSIPDIVKVGSVGVLGLALTVTGTLMSSRPKVNRVPAATVLGTGGGLGFVSLVGAALLGLMPSLVAFIALSAWTLVLMVLAVRTKLLFTTVIAALGGIATVVLAAGEVAKSPDQAFVGLVMTTAYATAITVTAAVTSRWVAESTFKPAYHLAATTVSLTALIAAPLALAHTISPLGTMVAWGVLVALHLVQAVLIAGAGNSATSTASATADSPAPPALRTNVTNLISDAARNPWLGVWALVPLLVIAQGVMVASAFDWQDSAFPFGYMMLGLLALTTLAHLIPAIGRHTGGWPAHALSLSALTALWVCPWGDQNQQTIAYVVTVAVVLLTVAPALRERDHLHVWTLPIIVACLGGSLSTLWGALAVTVVVALAIVVCILVDAHSAATAPTGPTGAPVVPADAPWRTPLILLLLLFGLPFGLHRLIWHATHSSIWALAASAGIGLVAACALIALGIAATMARPVELFTGRHAGARPELLASPFPGVVGRPSSPNAFIVPIAAWIYAQGIGLATHVVDLQTSGTPGVLHWDWWIIGPLVLALTAATLWANVKVMRNSTLALTTVIACTLMLLQAILLITGAEVGSIIASVTLLGAGAAAIGLGFHWRSKAVRLYGLVLVMLMVVKFAFWDLGSDNTLQRVIALFVAGLVCFGLSVVYSRVDSQLSGPKDEGDAALGPAAPAGAPTGGQVPHRPAPAQQPEPGQPGNSGEGSSWASPLQN